MVWYRFAISLFAAMACLQVAQALDDWPPEGVTKIETETGARVGAVAIDLKSGHRIENRPNELFPMCSTFKLLAVAAVLQRVERGEEKLDRFVHYTQADLLEYAR